MLIAQEKGDNVKKKDNSKPTNLYSQVDNFLEFSTNPTFNTISYKPKLSLALSESFSLISDVPFIYNTKNKKFGLGDVRFRSFWVPYKNYEKTVGSFGASLDIVAPTGKYDYGFGSSSWRFSPGFIIGIIANDAQTISFFPNLSYTFTSNPSSELVPKELDEADHGYTFQVLSSFVLNDDAFLLVTPIYDVKDFTDAHEDEFIIEIESVFDLMRDKYQAGFFYRAAFESESHAFSVYFTVFL